MRPVLRIELVSGTGGMWDQRQSSRPRDFPAAPWETLLGRCAFCYGSCP